jgi:transposase
MSKRKRRSFTDEFKAQAVELVLKSGKSVTEVARDLDLVPSALGAWVKRAKAAPTPAQKVLEDQGAELARLREEVRVLRMERDFAKKAAVFFAKESK